MQDREKQSLTQLVFLQQPAQLKQRRAAGHALVA